MAPNLEKVFILRLSIDKIETLNLGSTKGGQHRLFVPVTGGFIESSSNSGNKDFHFDIVQGGSDCPRLDPSTGIFHIDARFAARDAETGDTLFGSYPGVIKTNGDDPMQQGLAWSDKARTTESKEHYWVTTPTFEVSREDMKWMEQTVFVGHGHWYIPGDGRQAVEYEIYRKGWHVS